jgi:lipopolysaccharide transport system permease protein
MATASTNIEIGSLTSQRGASEHDDATGCDPPVVMISSRSDWKLVDFGELWRFRELLFFLIWRDVKVRYKQTVLGALWAILQPLGMMVVFSLFLGRVARATTSDVPYPLFVLCGLLPWMFLSTAIMSASQSLVGSQNMISKVYFPRLMMPLSAVGAGVVDFAIGFAMLLIAMVGFGRWPGPWMLTLPLLALGILILAAGLGTLLAGLTAKYRDFRYVIPFAVQFWMFATPSIYLQSEHAIESIQRLVLPLNPAHGLIANFRAAILNQPPDPYSLGVSCLVGLVVAVAGAAYFRSVETCIADVI